MKKTYSQEFKEQIIQEHCAGSTVTELSKEYSLSRNTIYTWIEQHGTAIKRTKPINMREYNDLQQKCEQLEKMVEILQESPCTVKATLSERYAVIQSLSDKYSVSLLCKTMKVAKGSYYNHILRNKNEDTLAAQKRAEITPIIQAIFEESQQVYGASKIHAILKDRGYQISPNTVADIMHDNGWFSSRGGAKKLYLKSQERKQIASTYKMKATKPNEIWVGDVTIFSLSNVYYYICVILDIYSRRVVGYRISTCNSTQLTKATFKMAYERREPTELHFHSDQGRNYISRTYVDYLKSLGVKQTFSRPSKPYDNSIIEAFFKSLKTEKLYRTEFRSERELKESVKEYIEHYNSARPHEFLNYKTPDAFEKIFHSKQATLHESELNTCGSYL